MIVIIVRVIIIVVIVLLLLLLIIITIQSKHTSNSNNELITHLVFQPQAPDDDLAAGPESESCICYYDSIVYIL